MLKLISVSVFVALVAAPAIAQAPAAAPAQAQSTAKKQDPNEKICVKEESTGSRLGAKRICMTRAEWADRKLQDQQELTRVQTQRSGPAGN
jgi:hypothetical protein